jgi:hypothetical protein
MQYPNLSRAIDIAIGDDDEYFDPTDPLVDKLMQGLLKEINHLLSTKYTKSKRCPIMLSTRIRLYFCGIQGGEER